MSTELCHCGKPLHYSKPETKDLVERIIKRKGTHQRVTVGKRSWLVQRHYIALHGIEAEKLPSLGFEEISSSKSAGTKA